MSKYNAIKINKGPSGFGGPLTVKPTEEKNVLLYITGGGAKPDIVDKIVELTGCEAVNGFKTSVPEEQIFLVIIDCGGTLRYGLYYVYLGGIGEIYGTFNNFALVYKV